MVVDFKVARACEIGRSSSAMGEGSRRRYHLSTSGWGTDGAAGHGTVSALTAENVLEALRPDKRKYARCRAALSHTRQVRQYMQAYDDAPYLVPPPLRRRGAPTEEQRDAEGEMNYAEHQDGADDGASNDAGADADQADSTGHSAVSVATPSPPRVRRRIGTAVTPSSNYSPQETHSQPRNQSPRPASGTPQTGGTFGPSHKPTSPMQEQRIATPSADGGREVTRLAGPS
eukprot:GHVT01039412.1.p1 GENE.GHVT01039412.1~~GHVT01039412.1.p1  ORF type:complete len:230 (-),score=45.88 GHVT01039412.1:131-820(-)